MSEGKSIISRYVFEKSINSLKVARENLCGSTRLGNPAFRSPNLVNGYPFWSMVLMASTAQPLLVSASETISHFENASLNQDILSNDGTKDMFL